MVVWDTYKPFDPGVTGPLHEQSRPEARAAYNRLMAAKEERIHELERLLAANGIALETSDDGLQPVNDWFRSEVEGDPATGRLRSLWYAVVNDLALVLGDEMIARAPRLHWAFFDKGRRDVAYQRHVIMGFGEVANPRYNVDIDLNLATYGHQIISGADVNTDQFVTWLRSVAAKPDGILEA